MIDHFRSCAFLIWSRSRCQEKLNSIVKKHINNLIIIRPIFHWRYFAKLLFRINHYYQANNLLILNVKYIKCTNLSFDQFTRF